ncbi:hypothetical protein BDZ97DRAFT_834923 [Flammula alnicola]|nr:hypothetical protein BDZ97DRAFT_834923 [Flammula alnicola]
MRFSTQIQAAAFASVVIGASSVLANEEINDLEARGFPIGGLMRGASRLGRHARHAHHIGSAAGEVANSYSERDLEDVNELEARRFPLGQLVRGTSQIRHHAHHIGWRPQNGAESAEAVEGRDFLELNEVEARDYDETFDILSREYVDLD